MRVNSRMLTLMNLKEWISVFLFLLIFQPSFTQNDVTLNLIGEFEYSGYFSCISAEFDQLNSPYLYTANVELGLVIFDISNTSQPIPIDTIPNASFNQLKVNHVRQVDNYLYLALGSFQGFTQKAGLAILNIEDPTNILIEDKWSLPNYNKGGVFVDVIDDFAYLAAMSKGLIILDISDKQAIEFKSHILPDLNWPVIPGLFNTPNARGIETKDDILYLCFDAGGIRVIDISDKENPEEIHKYINSDLTDIAAPAYNKIAIKGDYAFATVDYCGLEVLDISDPDTIKKVDWINPWDCKDTSWFGSEGHTNQLAFSNDSSLLFVSGGDSEVLVFSVDDPENIELIGAETMINDSAVTWGLNIRNDELVLCLLDNSGIFDLDSLLGTLQPYYSNYGGIKLYSWESLPTNIQLKNSSYINNIFLKPNPVLNNSLLHIELSMDNPIILSITDIQGKILSSVSYNGKQNMNIYKLETNSLNKGIYFATITIENEVMSIPFIKH